MHTESEHNREAHMARALCRNRVIAESPQALDVDGELYFPLESIDPHVLRPSATVTQCPLRGPARHYHLMIDGVLHPDAVRCFPEPDKCLDCIRNHAAFTGDILIEP